MKILGLKLFTYFDSEQPGASALNETLACPQDNDLNQNKCFCLAISVIVIAAVAVVMYLPDVAGKGLVTNNYNNDDCIIITRIFLNKLKLIIRLSKEYENNNNLDVTISSAKPPIFWKDKDIVKKQIKNWNIRQTENLISEINNVELLIKKNTVNSYFILLDFIFSKSKITNN